MKLYQKKIQSELPERDSGTRRQEEAHKIKQQILDDMRASDVSEMTLDVQLDQHRKETVRLLADDKYGIWILRISKQVHLYRGQFDYDVEWHDVGEDSGDFVSIMFALDREE